MLALGVAACNGGGDSGEPPGATTAPSPPSDASGPVAARCGPDEAFYVSSIGPALGQLRSHLSASAGFITAAALDPESTRTEEWRLARRISSVNIDIAAGDLFANVVPDDLDELDRLLGALAADLASAEEQIDLGVAEPSAARFVEAVAAIGRAGGIVRDTIEYTNRLCGSGP